MIEIDSDEYNILHEAEEDGYLSFWLLIYYISQWNPELNIYQVYSRTYKKLEKLIEAGYIEIVEVHWQEKEGIWEDVYSEVVPFNMVKEVLNKPTTWDRTVSNSDSNYQLCITELGSKAMDLYEKI
ncbi:hypothetical protein V7087_28465 [Neobacillus niacini]|uniref:hypothetical protein n=1 Tax=Neobacillus niacini TaxID=86668 RepID=UPI002FFEE563